MCVEHAKAIKKRNKIYIFRLDAIKFEQRAQNTDIHIIDEHLFDYAYEYKTIDNMFANHLLEQNASDWNYKGKKRTMENEINFIIVTGRNEDIYTNSENID